MVKRIAFILFLIAIIIIGISAMIPDKVKRFFSIVTLQLQRFAQLTIGNEPPTVPKIYIDGVDCMTETCSFQGQEQSVVTMTITAMVNDTNGNCDDFGGLTFKPTAYLCSGTGPCNENTAEHIVDISTLQSQYGTGGIYCNYTGTIGIEYYETPGDWKINVTVYDGEYYGSNAAGWVNGKIIGFEYPDTGTDTIDYGSLNVGTWNDGIPTGGTLAWNTGNVLLNITWTVNDFILQGASQPPASNEIIPVGNSIPSNYKVDYNDNIRDDDADEFYLLNLTSVEAYPSGGFGVCQSHECPETEPGREIIYWHLYIGEGKKSGTYNNTIHIHYEEM